MNTERARREGSGEIDEKVNDNEFQESFKSLQRRDDEADMVDREARNFDEEESEPIRSERRSVVGDGVDEGGVEGREVVSNGNGENY